MILCIGKQLIFKGTLVNDLFFGMRSIMHFLHRSLAFADSPRKFFLLFFPLVNIIPGSWNGILSRIFNVYPKTWLLTVKLLLLIRKQRKCSSIGSAFKIQIVPAVFSLSKYYFWESKNNFQNREYLFLNKY